MRICAGKFKGRRLKVSKEQVFRPTTERVREAIFSTLFSLLELGPESKVLDLYAGTGALGIEAISRGAGSAIFVERDKSAARALEENLLSLGLQANVFYSDVLKFLPECKGEFSLIFVDPPYAQHPGQCLLELIAKHNLLAPCGVLVIESAKDLEIAELAALPLFKEKYYGDTRVRYYRLIEAYEQ